MNRVLIISNCNFPRGAAIGNYVQYLMLAIKDAGIPVRLISNVNPEYISSEYISSDNKEIMYKGFEILPIHISNYKVLRHYQYKFGFVVDRVKTLLSLKPNKDDIVIVFGQEKTICSALLKLKKVLGFKIVAGMLELFDRENYFGKNAEHEYRKNQYVIDEIIPKCDAVLSISTYIAKYYEKKGVATTCIPIMADIDEYPKVKKKLEKYKFIIPANGMMKDDLPSMLKAFSCLSMDEIKRIELHLCGVKENQIKEILTENEYKKIRNCLTIHKWMKYDELIALYQDMNFLFLERGISQMTLANFPSKVPETMSHGIVPVVSRVGDYTEFYLNNGIDSVFIEGSSVEAGLDALRKVLLLSEEEYFRMSNNAIRCVQEKFDYHVWTPVIKSMLDSLQ